MPYLMSYTRSGDNHYRAINDSMHLALSKEGSVFVPLRNNTGVLFPKADLNDGTMPGCTKTLINPWLFRYPDGSGGVLAVRRNCGKPDPLSIGSVMVYRTKNFVFYNHEGFLKLDDAEIMSIRCRFNEKTAYYLEWETENGIYSGYTKNFITVNDIAKIAGFTLLPAKDHGILDAVPGNIVEISPQEFDYLDKMLGLIYNTNIEIPDIRIKTGIDIDIDSLPKATCIYNDGSTHQKKVIWDEHAIEKIDTTKPGKYVIPGEVIQKVYPTPFIKHAGDPCVFKYYDKYYFTSTNEKVVLRESDTIDGLREAEVVVIHDDPNAMAFWAQELHVINNVPYIFTSLCGLEGWSTVQSVIFRCDGKISDPAAWSKPYYVVKKDGTLLNKDKGICLDMTYFEIDGVHYGSWSNRDLNPIKDPVSDGGTNGTADVYIATIDPDAPWKLTSDPVCICRPDYGWDRLETEVVEGTYILRRGDDLFMSFSGASVGSVYCVGLLKAKYGSNLLDADAWEKFPYPILTKESVPGQYGPGHNNFVKDPDNEEDDLIVLLYRPLEGWIVPPLENREEENPRHAAIRRVHWNASGYPNFEMIPKRDLNPELRSVSLNIIIE